jgi:CIC family chloride channel protein
VSAASAPASLPPPAPDAPAAADRERLIVFALAAVGGLAIALIVAVTHAVVGEIQTLLFGADVDIVGTGSVPSWRVMAVTTLGGLALGGALFLAGRLHRLSIVDPVEANALEGGRMSLVDSLALLALCSLSISIGGSVGFEAAMTQIGAGLLSVAGQRLRLSRRSLRILVSCGTAAGIAAIFGAPLAGTLYALELVVGGYAVRALAPTLIAAAASGLATHYIIGAGPLFPAAHVTGPALWHYPFAVGVGIVAALLGIAVMRGTTAVEALLARLPGPKPLRPVIGGAALGVLAILVPVVTGPGHSGIDAILAHDTTIGALAAIVLAKAAASIVCIGSGFRGGLFSSSLFLGAAFGALLHVVAVVPLMGTAETSGLAVVTGMSAVAASVVGTPFAIVLLAVETTGIHSGIVSVAIAVVVANQLTKRWFGYSFSTWRFHVRGRDLAGPRDIGRLRALHLADVPLVDLPRFSAGTPCGEAAAATYGTFALVVAVEGMDGRFVGLVRRDHLLETAEKTPATAIEDLVETVPVTAHVADAVADHVEGIAEGVAGVLPVLDAAGRLAGTVPERAVLKRYLDELLAADRDDAGPMEGRRRD